MAASRSAFCAVESNGVAKGSLEISASVESMGSSVGAGLAGGFVAGMGCTGCGRAAETGGLATGDTGAGAALAAAGADWPADAAGRAEIFFRLPTGRLESPSAFSA
jgi:hypothetical protein